jgi:hypothetical protein
MIKTRLSADAADASMMKTQAKTADTDRMLHQDRMMGVPESDKLETLRMINCRGPFGQPNSHL